MRERKYSAKHAHNTLIISNIQTISPSLNNIDFISFITCKRLIVVCFLVNYLQKEKARSFLPAFHYFFVVHDDTHQVIIFSFLGVSSFLLS